MVKLLFTAVAFLMSASAWAGADLKMLVREPQFMPEKTTATETMKFGGGTVIKAGTVLRVVEIEGANVNVALPGKSGIFGVSPESTSFLKDADAYIATLSPEQQKATRATLVARKELLPYRVTVTSEVRFDGPGGLTFKPGQQHIVEAFDGKIVTVYIPDTNRAYDLPADTTSIYKQCLANMAGLPMSRLYNELKENAFDAATGKATTMFDDGGPEYVALYMAAGWCPFCAQTTPDVVKWQQDSAAAPAGGKTRVALLLVSSDKSLPELAAHLKAKEITFPYVKPGGLQRMPRMQATGVNSGLPTLIVVDRTGKVVVDSTNDQPKERTLKALAKMIELREQAQASVKP